MVRKTTFRGKKYTAQVAAFTRARQPRVYLTVVKTPLKKKTPISRLKTLSITSFPYSKEREEQLKRIGRKVVKG